MSGKRYLPLDRHRGQADVSLSMNKQRIVTERSKRYAVFGLTAGIFCGFLLCLWSKPMFPCMTANCCLKQQLREEIRLEMNSNTPYHTVEKKAKLKQVLIGVMTAAQFVDNRALAVWRTWAREINGDVVFFSSEGSVSTYPDMPLVALPGVTDSYPPQKKSFMMLKYLHNYGADKYKYFMRVDDDIYIHGHRLNSFLNSLNHSKALYIGQAGVGNAQELGLLSLSPDENFCMGGPGIIFSAETLRRTVPHISYCLQHLLTSHEDVELGRCIRMFAGIPCTWNYEMQKLFHHSYSYRTNTRIFPYVLTGSEMDRAITLHPVKEPQVMYKIFNEMKIKEKSNIEKRMLHLRSELSLLDSQPISHVTLQSTINVNTSVEDTIPWKFFTRKHQFSYDMFSVKRNHDESRKSLLQRAINYVMVEYNDEAQLKGRVLENFEVVYGYYRTHPTRGIQLILNLKMLYVRTKGKSMKSPVHKRVFLEQPFSAPEIRRVDVYTRKVVHLIMPLSGKIEELKRFLNRFSLVCGESRICRLVVVLYRSDSYNQTIELIQASKYKNLITVLEGRGDFSRAQSLHQGVESLSDNDLMLFIDVDIYYDRGAIERVQQHTKLDEQAYFPIVFSQYDSHMVCGDNSCPVSDLSEKAGSFRYFGFGIASMYNADYIKCGGFDLTIHGWGKEDVDLYTKVLKSDIEVFRAADPGIIHIYHEKICDDSLNSDQMVMCRNSKASSFASKESLAKLYFKTQSNPL